MTTKWAGWVVAALALAALAAGAVYAASHSAEVRITARQLEDGRVEFALQQRVDGEWGERQLPRSRFFPANVGHNRWLNSTPLTVSAAADQLEDERIDQSEAAASSATTTLPIIHPRSSGLDDRIAFGAESGGRFGFRTALSVYGQTDDWLYDRASITFYCDASDPNADVWVSVSAWGSSPMSLKESEPTRAIIGNVYTGQQWTFATYDDEAQLSSTGEGASFMAAAKRERWLTVHLPSYSGTVAASFDMDGVFDTLIQPNLDRCGEYVAY